MAAAAKPKIGVLGSGDVGRDLAIGLVKAGYSIKMATRDPSKLNDKLKAWADKEGKGIGLASFPETAKFGDVLLLVTAWTGTQEGLKLCGEDNLKGKVLIDATNPVGMVNGNFEVTLQGNQTSSGELVQGWAKSSKVVKCFNMIGHHHMVNPDFKGQKPDMCIAGNDDGAKKVMTEILGNIGWSKEHVLDFGKIDSSRYLEAMCILWCRYMVLNNFSVNHAWALLRK